MMQVNVHIEDSLIFLSQFEDSQHGIVHVTEARGLVPGRQERDGEEGAHWKVTALPTAPSSGYSMQLIKLPTNQLQKT